MILATTRMCRGRAWLGGARPTRRCGCLGRRARLSILELSASRLGKERAWFDVKITDELGDLGAVELAFSGQHFGDGRFGDAGAVGSRGLRDALLLDQETKQVGVADRLARHRLGLVGLDQ